MVSILECEDFQALLLEEVLERLDELQVRCGGHVVTPAHRVVESVGKVVIHVVLLEIGFGMNMYSLFFYLDKFLYVNIIILIANKSFKSLKGNKLLL